MNPFDDLDAIVRRVVQTEPDCTKAAAQVRGFLTPEIKEGIIEDAIQEMVLRRIYAARGNLQNGCRQAANRLSREGIADTLELLDDKFRTWYLPNGKSLLDGTVEDLRSEADRLGRQALGTACKALLYARLAAKMKPGQTVREVWTSKQILREYARVMEGTRALAPSPHATAPLEHPKGIHLLPCPDEGQEPQADAS